MSIEFVETGRKVVIPPLPFIAMSATSEIGAETILLRNSMLILESLQISNNWVLPRNCNYKGKECFGSSMSENPIQLSDEDWGNLFKHSV